MIILIPAYEPDARLTALVAALRRAAPESRVIVVDDGSGPRFAGVFDDARAAGALVIGYPLNRGKGVALKTGLTHVIENHPGHDVVCADSDGQHTVPDILRVADEVARGRLVLGGRRFTGEVPTRSRVGNAVSRRAFGLATGLAVHDTQTGLRGYSAHQLEWLLGIRGNRFEYELNVLLASRSAGVEIVELEIETLYLERNASSHFRPVIDSVRVLAPLLAFTVSSLAAFAIDAVGLVLLFAITGSLPLSVVGARFASASVNFLVNRRAVFPGGGGSLRRDLVRYVALALALLASSYVWLSVLTGWGLPLVAAKLLTDITLYVASFQVQRRFVFTPAQQVVNRDMVKS